MEIKNNKKCIICGTAYSYCPTCSRDQGKPSWYAIFCSDNCNDIYNIVTEYRDGIIDINEAYERIKKCDLSTLENDEFNAGTRGQIYEILSLNEEKYSVLVGKKANTGTEEIKTVSDTDTIIGEENVEPINVETVETPFVFTEEVESEGDENKIPSSHQYYNKHFNKKKK